MASNLEVEYKVFLCIFQKNSAMATLGMKEMGKFLWEGRVKGLPCWLSQFSKTRLRQPSGQTFSLPSQRNFPISFKPKVAIRTKVRNLKLKVPLVKKNVLCRCQLVSRTSKSAGAGGDVQNFGGCQAPVAPVLTQALYNGLGG